LVCLGAIFFVDDFRGIGYMEYSDERMRDHELKYWIESYAPPFLHFDFYRGFFNFSELSGRKVVDIGCGGAPVTDYCGASQVELTIVDPIISKLVQHDKFRHLSLYRSYSGSLFDFNGRDYEYLICLNVIDHFNDPECNFIDKFKLFLAPGGVMWLYFDVRDVNDGEHLAVDENKVLSKIEQSFSIIKLDESVNPTHVGWSSVRKSIRLVAKKFLD